eukprot:5929348-Pyramimonas_sp.AAC.1
MLPGAGGAGGKLFGRAGGGELSGHSARAGGGSSVPQCHALLGGQSPGIPGVAGRSAHPEDRSGAKRLVAPTQELS